MFKKDTINNNGLVFVKSRCIKVFPCSRRKSELVDADGNDNTVSDKYYIPFDPESRLNTEANNRKHSALNGYTQTYLNYWSTDGELSVVLAGYLFNIATGETGTDAVNNFGKAILKALDTNTPTAIYVNIKLANMTFFSSGTAKIPEATTEVLRNQSTTKEPLACLDLFSGSNKTDPDQYYFYGLSLSSENLSKKCPDEGFVSLQLLDYNNDGNWIIHEASRLPKIAHGDEKDSIVVGNLHVTGDATVDGTLWAKTILQGTDGKPAASLEVVKTTEGQYQLQFYVPGLTVEE